MKEQPPRLTVNGIKQRLRFCVNQLSIILRRQFNLT